MLYISKIIGAIFCQVNKSKQFNHLRPSITSGNQKWNGAAPIFIRRAEFRIIKGKHKDSVLLFILVLVIIIIIENKIIVEAIAWVTKYFRDASVRYIFLFLENNGIIESKLISNPSHIPIHE